MLVVVLEGKTLHVYVFVFSHERINPLAKKHFHISPTLH